MKAKKGRKSDGSGMGSPSSSRPSRRSVMASRIKRPTSSSDSPAATHPGESGTYAARFVPASSTTIAYRLVANPCESSQPARFRMLASVLGGRV
jgi:hypothetical protein